MSVKRYDIPQGTRLAAPSGHATPPWHNYLRGIHDVSGRVAAVVEPLDAGASTAATISKVNELIAALQAAGLMRES